MQMMEINRLDNGLVGTLEAVSDDGLVAGYLAYRWSGARQLVVEHTEVDERFKGKSIGRQLIAELVSIARNEHLKVEALCPFAKSVLERDSEYRDILS